MAKVSGSTNRQMERLFANLGWGEPQHDNVLAFTQATGELHIDLETPEPVSAPVFRA